MNVDINKLSINTKNIVYLILLIGQASWVVFMVFANQRSIETMNKRSFNSIETMNKRSLNRYNRGMNLGKDHEFRIWEIEAFMNFSKGEKNTVNKN